ncbi:unnamed protein product [Ectocarpus sp. 13 AM-2016]
MRPRPRLPRPTALSPVAGTLQAARVRSSLLEAALRSVVGAEASGGGSGGKSVGDDGAGSRTNRDGTSACKQESRAAARCIGASEYSSYEFFFVFAHVFFLFNFSQMTGCSVNERRLPAFRIALRKRARERIGVGMRLHCSCS